MPPKKIPRQATSFRATAEQIAAWRAIAAAHGIGYSDWIRRVLDEVPLPPPPTPLQQSQSVALSRLGRLVYQLSKLGTNLNQLTRMAHQGENVTEQVLPVLQHLVTEVDRIEKRLFELRDSGFLLPKD